MPKEIQYQILNKNLKGTFMISDLERMVKNCALRIVRCKVYIVNNSTSRVDFAVEGLETDIIILENLLDKHFAVNLLSWVYLPGLL